MSNKTMWRVIAPMAVRATVVLALALSFSADFTHASIRPVFAASLCGDGSAPDYGFTTDRQQAHWTVGWQDYASEQAVSNVDTILDRLNSDSVAQTMILILPQAQVGNRVNCAVHFLRYMQLGEPTGERKDNGFVFLIVVEPTLIDVHYGVGLGLPALTASDLTDLNRAAEDAYQPGHDMDQALLTLTQGFDTLSRSKYAALVSIAPTPEPTNQQPASGPVSVLAIVGQLCLGIVILGFLLWAARRRITSYGSGGNGFPFGGGGSGFDGGRVGFGGDQGGSSMRGGSGSGRSGRGN